MNSIIRLLLTSKRPEHRYPLERDLLDYGKAGANLLFVRASVAYDSAGVEVPVNTPVWEVV